MAEHALVQLGMDLEDPSTAQADTPKGEYVAGLDDERQDFFIVKDGVTCAGTHLIIDLHGAEGLDDIGLVDRALRKCVDEANATLLHIHLHHFTPNAGISGVAVLAESHISIHTWPERNYAALDVFMCGAAEPERCVAVLEEAFRPNRIEVDRLLRGQGA